MEYQNVLLWFLDTAKRQAQETCFRFKRGEDWQTLRWHEVVTKVTVLSEALKNIGINSGDRVAILSSPRYEWTLYDIAITSLGAVSVPIYQSNMAEDVRYILEDSGTKAIVVEDLTQLEKVLQVRDTLNRLQQIILLEGTSSVRGVVSHEVLEERGKDTSSDFDVRVRSLKRDQLFTLVYTSGTTGIPMGVMLTHGNILAEMKGLTDRVRMQDGIILTFLPLAHILARVVQWIQLTVGFENAYAENIEKLGDNIAEIRPHYIICVPRIFEKIYIRILAQVEAGSTLKKKIFYFSRNTGLAFSRRLQNKQPVPLWLRIKYLVATKLVFSKIQKKLGGRIRFLVSGGAPLSKKICEFFHGAGLIILEGYGLTETTAAINGNGLEDYCFGSVGRPLLGVEEKIAQDGEILVRGPMVGKGYWNHPESTQEVFEPNGWFHTGDIGEFDGHGHLLVRDRKKDIIITAGGKNIAPQKIENLIKTHPLISQVVVHGDRRKFLSALITLNQEEVVKLAETLGIPEDTVASRVKDPKMQEMVKDIIEGFNKKLPPYENIRKFAVLDKEFTVEGGELTPTLKVKRKIIQERYGKVFDGFYE